MSSIQVELEYWAPDDTKLYYSEAFIVLRSIIQNQPVVRTLGVLKHLLHFLNVCYIHLMKQMPEKKLKKPKFKVDKIWRSAINGKFKLLVYRSSSRTFKVVDTSTCHQTFSFEWMFFNLCFCKYSWRHIFYFKNRLTLWRHDNVSSLSCVRLPWRWYWSGCWWRHDSLSVRWSNHQMTLRISYLNDWTALHNLQKRWFNS